MNIWIPIVAAVAALVVVYMILNRVRRKYQTRMVTCVIRPEQLNDVTAALKRANLMVGMTVMDVRGFGRQQGGEDSSRNQEIRFLPKLRIEILVRSLDVEATMEAITKALHTGQIGDGKIVVFEAVSAMRIRTGEKGISAL